MIKGEFKSDILSQEEFSYLISLLASNEGMTEGEFDILKEKHPYAIVRDDNIHIIVDKMTHYTKYDKNLEEFVINKFGNNSLQIDFLYKITYCKGEYTVAHEDKESSKKTILVLLNDSFKGGDLLVSGINTNFNKKGMFIEFNGFLNTHEVLEVTEGQRDVLVIFLERKTSLF